jgi:hypothetical protein
MMAIITVGLPTFLDAVKVRRGILIFLEHFAVLVVSRAELFIIVFPLSHLTNERVSFTVDRHVENASELVRQTHLLHITIETTKTSSMHRILRRNALHSSIYPYFDAHFARSPSTLLFRNWQSIRRKGR